MDLETYKFKVKILKNMINSLEEYNNSSVDKNELIESNATIISNIKELVNNLENNLDNYRVDKNTESDNNIKLTPEEKDTLEYKKNYSLLNKSFWEAREKVATEKIKFPSSLYEQKVKEYQNQFLIDNFNISLEEIEYNIDFYKEKYASNIYMDSVYDRALSKIKETNTCTIEEICDESNGISLLDRYVYDILIHDLNDIVNKIDMIDEFDDAESKDLLDFRKELNNKKIQNKKSIIEEQINIIREKAKEFDDEL